MASFSGNLYVGGYHSLLIYRTDGTSGTAKSWVDVTDGVAVGGGTDGVWSLGTYNGKLYMGGIGVLNGKILWATTDGKSWAPIDTKDVGVDKTCADALMEFKGSLYMTTRRPIPKSFDEKLEIWRYGPWKWDLLFKLLLAHKPIIWVPPPPVWIQFVKAWVARVTARVQDLISKHRLLCRTFNRCHSQHQSVSTKAVRVRDA